MKKLIFHRGDPKYDLQLFISAISKCADSNPRNFFSYWWPYRNFIFCREDPKYELQLSISASWKCAAWLNKKRVYLVIITCGNRSWRTARTRFKIEIKWSKSDILHHWAVHLMIFSKTKKFSIVSFWPKMAKFG